MKKTITITLLAIALMASFFSQAQPTEQIQKLRAADSTDILSFGTSVSISGNYAIVGIQDQYVNPGAAYIFYNNEGIWEQQAKLTTYDGDVPDLFGFSVCISGDYAIVGAFIDDLDQGAAYVFEKPAGGWSDMTQTAKLTASDAASGDNFGYSVSISGDYVVVGAYGAGDGSYVGAAYIFEKPATGWADMTQTAKLTASDGDDNDDFGIKVSISGDYAIVGASQRWYDHGSAYVFEKPATGWTDMTQTAKLTASDGDESDFFGTSVSISGDYAIVGAYGDDYNGSRTGSAYVFEKPAGGWSDMTQTAKLTASDGELGDYFGFHAVSISDDYAIVGACGVGSYYVGAAYIFVKPATGWADMTEKAKLTASDGAEGDWFGISVCISGDYAIVGAHGDDVSGDPSGEAEGSAYIFGLPICAGFQIICPPDVRIECDESTDPANTGMALSISGCGYVTFTFSDVTTTPASDDDYYTITRTWTATDENGNTSSCDQTITVNPCSCLIEDNTEPVLIVVSDPITFWPPNHKYEAINIGQLFVSVTDNCVDLSVNDVYIDSVTSDEEEDAPGNNDGSTLDDIVISSACDTVYLRRERNKKGNGRVYTINLAVDDGNGNTGTAACQVHVPIGKDEAAIEDEVAYEEECGGLKSSFVAFIDDDIQLTNYPNPFNGNTTITFTLTETDNTTLKVYDTFGKEVATLFDGMAESGQQYTLNFSSGNLSKGIYLYHLQSGNKVSVVKKMILIK